MSASWLHRSSDRPGRPSWLTGGTSSGGSGRPSWLTGGSQPASGGGGFFHWVGSKIDLAARDVKGIPGGLYHAGVGLVEDIPHPGRLAHYGLGNLEYSFGLLRNDARLRADARRQWQQSEFGKQFMEPMVEGTVQTVGHPLRDPFQTALLAAPAASAIGRIGEVGAAARAAEGGIGAKVVAGTNKLFEPRAQPYRTLHVGDERTPVTLIGSRNPAIRFAQAGYDRMLQRALDREAAGIPSGRIGDRIATHAWKRISGAGAEELRIQQRMAAVPANLLDDAARKLTRGKRPSTRRLYQAATELTSQQVPPEWAAAYHYKQAANGINPEMNVAAAKIYERVAERNLVHFDPTRPAGQKVFINPDLRRLAKADERLANVQRRGDTILSEHEIMTPEELQARIDAPGRIRAGAHYEAPTPAKLGIPSAKEDYLAAYERRLAAVSERADERVRRLQFTAADRKRMGEGPPSIPVDTADLRDIMRPLEKELRRLTEEWNAPAKQGGRMSEEEARARFASLDATLDALKERIVPHVSPYGKQVTGSFAKAEQLARNTEWGKRVRAFKAYEARRLKKLHPDWDKERLRAAVDAAAARNVPKPKTVKAEELGYAEDKIRELAASGGHPVFEKAAELLAERDNLYRLIFQHDPFYEGPREPMPLKPGGEGSPYEQRAEVHRTLREGTAAEKQVQRFAAKAGTDPTVHGVEELRAQADALTEQIDELRGPPTDKILELRKEVADIRKQIIAAEAPQARLVEGNRPYVTSARGEKITPIGYERAERIAGGLSVVRERLQQIRAAAANRVKPTGIVGGETALPGRGYTFEGVSEKRLARTEAARSQGPVHGVAGEPISKKPYTGRALELGLRPKDITSSASRHFRILQRFENTDRLRRYALRTGSNVRRSERDGLLAIPGETQAELTSADRQLLGQQTPSVDTLEEATRHAADAENAARTEGLRAAYEMQRQHIVNTFRTSKNQQIGMEAPKGYRWVDENEMKGLLDESPPRGGVGGGIIRVADDVNSAVTAATVYLKVGHAATRVFTNAATNFIQGSLRPDELGKTLKLRRALGDEDTARMLAASGQHGFSSLPHAAPDWIGHIAGRGAEFWARHADAFWRFNSLAFELRKAGYHTAEQVKVALDALEHHGDGVPAHEWSKISTAARRADREAISYDRLNSFEKRYLTRLVWFYPWIKGSTVFTVRSILEHPYKMAALGVAGAKEREREDRQLGERPSYESGLISLGGGASPLTTDFSTFSPFGTAADVAFAGPRPEEFSGFLNPAAGAADQFIHGLNRYGAPSKRPYFDALLAIAQATPEQQFAESFGQGDQSGRMFHKTPMSNLLRYLVGPGMPRRINLEALAKAAAREKGGQR